VYVERIFAIVSWLEYSCSWFFYFEFCLTIPVEQVVMDSTTDDSEEIVIFEPEPELEEEELLVEEEEEAEEAMTTELNPEAI
jgi:hypothetical protein